MPVSSTRAPRRSPRRAGSRSRSRACRCASPTCSEEKKGPRVGAPDSAIAGLPQGRGAQVDRRGQDREGRKKGDFYVAVIEKPGRPAIEVIAEIVPEVVKTFPWPKSMRWGVAAHAALGAAAAFHRRDLRAGDRGAGDRARSRSTASRPATPRTAIASWRRSRIKVRRLDDYVAKLEKAKVVLDPGAPAGDHPRPTPRTSPSRKGYDLVEDAGLLAEVAGLVEWPVVLMGSFDEEFLPSRPRSSAPPSATTRNASCCAIGKTGSSPTVHPRRQHRGERRRQGDRRRQRARHPRAALRREVLLRDRSEDAAGRPAAEVRRTSCSTRSSAPRPSASSASSARRPSWRRSSAPTCQKVEARGAALPRPTCSPRWSANSPSCRA